MTDSSQLNQAIEAVKNGGIIAYPTEAVYGLGCDPFNKKAVLRLLKLKKRDVNKGLILIASHVQQIVQLIKPNEADDLARALKTWPGHTTWVFPKSKLVPKWVSGKHNTIAIRVSSHPFVKKLCDRLNYPIVSTSANISNEGTLNSIKEIKTQFNNEVIYYFDAPLGNKKSASTIRNAHTNISIR